MKKILILIYLLFISSPVLAQFENKMGLGLNYPGISFKYFVTKYIALEPKIQLANDVFAGGIRGNYYFSELVYSGLELAYIIYEGDVSEGSGVAFSPYAGIEISATDNITLQLDIGPVFIHMADKDFDVTGNYFQIMGNIGLNYYFNMGAQE